MSAPGPPPPGAAVSENGARSLANAAESSGVSRQEDGQAAPGRGIPQPPGAIAEAPGAIPQPPGAIAEPAGAVLQPSGAVTQTGSRLAPGAGASPQVEGDAGAGAGPDADAGSFVEVAEAGMGGPYGGDLGFAGIWEVDEQMEPEDLVCWEEFTLGALSNMAHSQEEVLRVLVDKWGFVWIWGRGKIIE